MNLIDILRQEINNLLASFISSEVLVNLLTVLTMVFFWVLLGFTVIKVTKLIILKTKRFQETHSKQGLTVRALINSVIRLLFFLWIAFMILTELGINVLPILASAGVLAFAIGFGAQELIKDVISGFFLILEGTFVIGDFVTIGSNSGTIEEIGLRRTKIKNWKGEMITINNGDIKTVINSSINPSIAVIEFKIDFRKDIDLFNNDHFRTFIKEFANSNEEVIDEGSPTVITDLLGGDVTLRVTFTTRNRKHIGVERGFRLALLQYTRDNNIDLEVPVVLEQDQLK